MMLKHIFVHIGRTGKLQDQSLGQDRVDSREE